jgi:hypothetical protein
METETEAKAVSGHSQCRRERGMDDIRAAFGEWVRAFERGNAGDHDHEQFATSVSHYILRAMGVAEITRDGIWVMQRNSYDPEFGYETKLIPWHRD